MSSRTEYHLIELYTGESHGGFASLSAARKYAQAEGFYAWDIWRGNRRVELHDPSRRDAVASPVPSDPADLRRTSMALAERANHQSDRRLKDSLAAMALSYMRLAITLEAAWALKDSGAFDTDPVPAA